MKFLFVGLFALLGTSFLNTYGASSSDAVEDVAAARAHPLKKLHVIDTHPLRIFEKQNGDFVFVTLCFPGGGLIQLFSRTENKIIHELTMPLTLSPLFLKEDERLLTIQYDKTKEFNRYQASFIEFDLEGHSSPATRFSDTAHFYGDECNLTSTLDGEKIVYYENSTNTLMIFNAADKKKTHWIPLSSPHFSRLTYLGSQSCGDLIFNKQGNKIYGMLTAWGPKEWDAKSVFATIDLQTASIQLRGEILDGYEMGALSQDRTKISLLNPRFGDDLLKIMDLETSKITHTIKVGRLAVRSFFIKDAKKLLMLNLGGGPWSESVSMIDLETRALSRFPLEGSSLLKTGCVSRDGKNLLLSFNKGPLQIFSLEEGEDGVKI